MSAGFLRGLGYWWSGWGHLKSRRSLLILAAAPALLAVGLVLGSAALIFRNVTGWSARLTDYLVGADPGGWRDVVYYPIAIGSTVLIVVAALLGALVVYSVVAMPFHAALAGRVLGPAGSGHSAGGIWTSLKRTAVLLTLGSVCFVASFIPGINLLATAGAVALMTYDTLDYAFDARDFTTTERLRYLRQHRAEVLGMATALGLTLLIPGLTFLVLPGAVVGAALHLKESA